MAILTGNMQNGMPQPPSRSVSFQKMLDLEKKYRLERLQTSAYPPPVHRAHRPSLTSTSSASSPRSDSYPTQPSPPPEPEPQPQPQAQPNGSFSQEQNMVLLKAVRRSVALPSLSISIPPHPNISKSTEVAKPAKPVKPATKAPPSKSELRDEPSSESRAEQSKEVAKATKETKTVTFVAPDDGDLSDEQSICQSPTWEGYKEAEKKKKEGKKQKKKEKEQAAKDAKVAKKRLTARLSKIPPPNHPASKELSAASRGRKTPHRSAIDLPLAIQYRPHDDENLGDAQHALAKLTGQPYHPVGRRPPSRDDGFVGGVKLVREREEMEMRLAEIRQKVKQSSHGDQSKKPRAQKAISLDPSALPQEGPKASTASLEALKKDREISRPPLSMHPLFRHNRSNSTTTIDIATNADAPSNGSTPTLTSQISGPSPDSRGRPSSSGSSTSYVRSSRAQSSERAISGFRDEYKVGFFARLRGSSQPPKERAKAPDSPKTSTESYRRNAQLPATPATPARKPARPKAAPPAVQADPPSPSIGGTVGTAVDCPAPPRISSPAGSDASSSRTSLNQFAQSQKLHTVNRPVSPTFSFTSNMTSYFEHHPIDGSLRGSPESKPSTSTPTGTPSSSMFHLPEVIKTPSLTSQFNQATLFSQPTRATQSTGTINLTVTKMDSQPESRASERSSSSSYAGSHEVSPPVSPVSTPDTSRPQSQKGGAPIFGEVSKGSTASLVVETDQRVIRNSSHGVTISTDGNQDDTQSKRSKPLKDSEGASGRSTLPIDIGQEGTQTGSSKLDRDDTATPSKSPHAPTRPPLSTTSSMSSHYEEAQETIVPSPGRKGTLPSPTLRPQSQPPSPKITHKDDKTTSRPGSDISFLPPLKHQSLVPPNKGKAPTPQQKPESRIFPVISTPKSDRSRSMSPAPSMVSKTETLHSDDSELSGPASYLQEARKTTPAPAPNALKVMRPSNLRQSAVAPMTPMPDKPFAKMFVECCSCRFYHDMPSKVYECMVNPDSFVEDRRLGVSGAITTMVKCPWCGHNMSKDCCAGYMAMVTLKEKLH